MTKLDGFFVRFWGVRGSIACPGPGTVRYGGNTSCLEVRCGERIFILDAGTGLKPFDAALGGEGTLDADVLFTHTHLDHIWGWPWFTRLLRTDTALTVWAGHLLPDHAIEAVLARLLDEPFAPVRRETIQARLVFRDFRAGETFTPRPGVRVRTAPLNHPQAATGYRLEYDGRSICYLTDTEHLPGKPDANILGLIDGADMVIYDSTYTEAEFAAHRGWGHSTWEEGARLCDAAGVKTFVVFHHDPDHDDAFMDRIAAEVARVRPGSVVAREGLTLAP
ncbi:MAG: MBL fold metallo-hydrolase [Alphaproteobacteria bacterium]